MAPQINAQEALIRMERASQKLNDTSLGFKIQQLRKTRSNDAVQQLQSEAIVELFDALKQVQEAIWPILLVIPDTGSVRDAAQRQAGSTSTASALTRTSALTTKSSFTK